MKRGSACTSTGLSKASAQRFQHWSSRYGTTLRGSAWGHAYFRPPVDVVGHFKNASYFPGHYLKKTITRGSYASLLNISRVYSYSINSRPLRLLCQTTGYASRDIQASIKTLLSINSMAELKRDHPLRASIYCQCSKSQVGNLRLG
jgi:hypothetical protein